MVSVILNRFFLDARFQRGVGGWGGEADPPEQSQTYRVSA